jgi:hypothetical protein
MGGNTTDLCDRVLGGDCAAEGLRERERPRESGVFLWIFSFKGLDSGLNLWYTIRNCNRRKARRILPCRKVWEGFFLNFFVKGA